MQSKNKKSMTEAEARHIIRVKCTDCAVCDASAPSDAHEINQGQWWTSCALCRDCHSGSINGWHGQKRMWAVKKMDELAALNVTLGRIYGPLKRMA